MARDGRRWTTDAQEEWLKSKLPKYLEASAGQRYDKFWPPIYEEWFKVFREPSPDPEDPTDCDSDVESVNAPPSDNDEPIIKPKKRKRRQRHKDIKKRKVRMFVKKMYK